VNPTATITRTTTNNITSEQQLEQALIALGMSTTSAHAYAPIAFHAQRIQETSIQGEMSTLNGVCSLASSSLVLSKANGSMTIEEKKITVTGTVPVRTTEKNAPVKHLRSRAGFIIVGEFWTDNWYTVNRGLNSEELGSLLNVLVGEISRVADTQMV
jgi:hypothetical protein